MEYVWAFVIGGAICAVGQLLIDFTAMTPARILTLFVVLGVVLSAFGVYEPLVNFAGAGATVPIVGFGHTLFQGVKEAVNHYGWTGILTGGMTAAAGGVAMSLMTGLVIALLFKPKDQS